MYTEFLKLHDQILMSQLGGSVRRKNRSNGLEIFSVCLYVFRDKSLKVKVKVKLLSCVQPSATPWPAAFQAPPSMGFSRQECWSGVKVNPC